MSKRKREKKKKVLSSLKFITSLTFSRLSWWIFSSILFDHYLTSFKEPILRAFWLRRDDSVYHQRRRLFSSWIMTVQYLHFIERYFHGKWYRNEMYQTCGFNIYSTYSRGKSICVNFDVPFASLFIRCRKIWLYIYASTKHFTRLVNV